MTREWDAAGDALMAPDPARARAGQHPAGDHRPDDPGERAGGAGRGLRPHRRGEGPHRAVVRRRHVLRNAMLPVVTTIGLLTGGLLSGAVLTETVFAFSGIGSFVDDSIGHRDYPVLMGFIMIIAVIYVLVNLAGGHLVQPHRPEGEGAMTTAQRRHARPRRSTGSPSWPRSRDERRASACGRRRSGGCGATRWRSSAPSSWRCSCWSRSSGRSSRRTARPRRPGGTRSASTRG